MNQRLIFALLAICFASALNSAHAVEVALIGDKSKRAVFERISQEMKGTSSKTSGVLVSKLANTTTTVTVAESADDSAAIANQLLTADVAFLVVDSTQGPLPIVREQLIVSRQARVPSVVIYFSNTRTLLTAAAKDAAELLELEEMEMRELLNKYEMGGDRAAVLFDGDVAKVYRSEFAKGSTELARFLSTYRQRRPAQPLLRTVSQFNCYYYLLSNPEANGKGISLTDQSEIEVWVEGRVATATVKSKKLHKPGDNGEFLLALGTSLKATEGSRVLLLRNGATVGVGVVASVAR